MAAVLLTGALVLTGCGPQGDYVEGDENPWKNLHVKGGPAVETVPTTEESLTEINSLAKGDLESFEVKSVAVKPADGQEILLASIGDENAGFTARFLRNNEGKLVGLDKDTADLFEVSYAGDDLSERLISEYLTL